MLTISGVKNVACFVPKTNMAGSVMSVVADGWNLQDKK